MDHHQRETVYTAWDNHHPPPQPKHRSLEEKGEEMGPRSLPIEASVPRAPIPTPKVPFHERSDTSLEEPSFGVDTTFNSNNFHYQTPNDRDGDYSYAYDSSLSPAFIIKYDDQNVGTQSDEDSEGSDKKAVENIYEEIAENSSESNSESSGSRVPVQSVKKKKRRSDSENS